MLAEALTSGLPHLPPFPPAPCLWPLWWFTEGHIAPGFSAMRPLLRAGMALKMTVLKPWNRSQKFLSRGVSFTLYRSNNKLCLSPIKLPYVYWLFIFTFLIIQIPLTTQYIFAEKKYPLCHFFFCSYGKCSSKKLYHVYAFCIESCYMSSIVLLYLGTLNCKLKTWHWSNIC